MLKNPVTETVRGRGGVVTGVFEPFLQFVDSGALDI